MKVKKRKQLWMTAAILGAAVLIADLIAQNKLSAAVQGVLCGIGSSLLAAAAANFLILFWEEQHPKQMQQNAIESGDERNVMIREKAQSIAGQVLQWSILAAAWICVMAGGPLWITMVALGLFFGKIVLEIALNGYFQNRM